MLLMGNITETTWFEEQLENMEEDFPFLNGIDPDWYDLEPEDDVSTEIDLDRDVPDEIWEPKNSGDE